MVTLSLLSRFKLFLCTRNTFLTCFSYAPGSLSSRLVTITCRHQSSFQPDYSPRSPVFIPTGLLSTLLHLTINLFPTLCRVLRLGPIGYRNRTIWPVWTQRTQATSPRLRTNSAKPWPIKVLSWGITTWFSVRLWRLSGTSPEPLR